MQNTFNQGTHTHNYFPSQQELGLETKEPVTVRLPPKLITILETRAERFGSNRSKIIESILIKYLKSEKAIKKCVADMEGIVTQNFL